MRSKSSIQANVCKADKRSFRAKITQNVLIDLIGMSPLHQIQIILVEPSHSGNVGSAARAMKTMGLTNLRLVSERTDLLNEQAVALAAGATSVLESAERFSGFEQAIADCQLVIGTSARLRHLQNSLLEPRQCGETAVQHASQGKVALVFGRERVGLTNAELLKCQYHLHIPTNADYGSLNLAMAVQIVCYEVRMAWLALQEMPQNPPLADYPNQEALAHFFNHTERLYTALGFIRNDAVMPKLRRLYQRAKLETNELNLLRGMLTAVEKQLEKSRH